MGRFNENGNGHATAPVDREHPASAIAGNGNPSVDRRLSETDHLRITQEAGENGITDQEYVPDLRYSDFTAFPS